MNGTNFRLDPTIVKNATGHAPVAVMTAALVTSVTQPARLATTLTEAQAALTSALLATVVLTTTSIPQTQDFVPVKNTIGDQPTNALSNAMKDVLSVLEPANTNAFAVRQTTTWTQAAGAHVYGVTRTSAMKTATHLVEQRASSTQLSVIALLDNGGTANSVATALQDVPLVTVPRETA